MKLGAAATKSAAMAAPVANRVRNLMVIGPQRGASGIDQGDEVWRESLGVKIRGKWQDGIWRNKRTGGSQSSREG